ncbi:MAG: signal peptide peptidase SppA [Bacteroidia bacterium]
MKDFFKYFSASLLAIIISVGFFVLLTVGIIAAFASSADKPIKISKDSVLEIDFDFEMGDRSYTDFNPNTFNIDQVVGLDKFRVLIEKAKDDKKIKGILLNVSYVPFNQAVMKEARQILDNFKESGKFIIAYSESMNQAAYYVSSVADEVYLYPEANIEFLGLSTEPIFFKHALEKLKIDMQVVRGSNNKFKSAVEPFIADKMSPENREQIERFIGGMWSDMLSDISKSRNISVEKLNQIADSLWAVTPKGAVEYKLVDGVLYQDELEAKLKEKLELKEKEKINFITLKKYSKANRHSTKVSYSDGNIAVVYATGEIISGEGNDATIGSETTAKAIREARENEKVKVIVLRVNSPGGSALASDVIWREIEITKKVKPVVVSMGDLAASGGYYISCNADRIFAQPNTLTGSIGVFGMIPNMQGMFNEHLGITFDVAKTNHHSMITPFKPLTKDEINFIQKEVDRIYESFITKVAEGRKKTTAYVDSIGQGRVWCGTDALKLGLVDELGSLEDAVKYAANMVEVKEDDIKIIAYPTKDDDTLEEILMALEDLEGETETRSTLSKLFIEKANQLNKVVSNDRIQARMLFDVEIK